MADLKTPLTKLFSKHRVIFWYDDKQEMRADWDALQLDGVEKVEIDNNQFQLKHRILRQQNGPNDKFLLYHAGPAPQPADNWLLDIQLTSEPFFADQGAMWLIDLRLPVVEFRELVDDHTDFFKAAGRLKDLGKLVHKDDTVRDVKLKMVATCAKSEPRLDSILYALFDELAADKMAKFDLIERVGLAPFLWDRVTRAYGYAPAAEGDADLKDFAITLFIAGLSHALQEEPKDIRLNHTIVPLLQNWQDSKQHSDSFKTLSGEFADLAVITDKLKQHSGTDLVGVTLYELIDRKLIGQLVHTVTQRGINSHELEQIVLGRRKSVWFEQYAPLYAALETGGRFLHQLESADLTIQSLADGVRIYTKHWFRIDQLYRQFVMHAKASNQPTLLAALKTKIDDSYSNAFLFKLGNNWQHWVDGLTRWGGFPVRLQNEFYDREVAAYAASNKKIFVIISDGLRYEIGDELVSRIRQENRFQAELDSLVTLLPSFTQLGMAALLPQQSLQSLSFKPTDVGAILADGRPTSGKANRNKILDQSHNGAAGAFQAKAVLAMSREEKREAFRGKNVIYIYQNLIDDRGDKVTSEGQVFAAVEESLVELVTLLRTLAKAKDGANFVVTADHGFIYQDQPLAESEYISDSPVGVDVQVTNRRFILGTGLQETAGFKWFRAADVGLSSQDDTEMLIPKSIGRVRVKGSGSRYVHGGASLQEIIVPVVRINYKRKDDITLVDVDILQGGTHTITTGQFIVTFYQKDPVTDKVQPRSVRAGVYNTDGQLISNQITLTFDRSSTNAADREQREQFVLTTAADSANGQEIVLKLEEQHGATSHFKDYKKATYLYRRSFTSDFDF